MLHWFRHGGRKPQLHLICRFAGYPPLAAKEQAVQKCTELPGRACIFILQLSFFGKIFRNRLQYLIAIKPMYHAGLLQRFANGRRAAYTVHSGPH